MMLWWNVKMLLLMMLLTSCVAVRPYQKGHLLNPLMDDGWISSLDSKMQRSVLSTAERLGGGGGVAGASACPTCGG